MCWKKDVRSVCHLECSWCAFFEIKLRQEKIQLEQTLEQEQEYQVNKLMRKIDKLESDVTSKQTTLEQVINLLNQRDSKWCCWFWTTVVSWINVTRLSLVVPQKWWQKYVQSLTECFDRFCYKNEIKTLQTCWNTFNFGSMWLHLKISWVAQFFSINLQLTYQD